MLFGLYYVIFGYGCVNVGLVFVLLVYGCVFGAWVQRIGWFGLMMVGYALINIVVVFVILLY